MTDIAGNDAHSVVKTPDVGFEDFNLVIDRESWNPAIAGFQAPNLWDSQTYRVSNLTVHAHVRAPHTPTQTTVGVPIITYHDVGQNASICFNTFFNHARTTAQCSQIDTAKSHYHLTAPGHHTDEPNVGHGVDLSFDALVRDVLTVLDRFDLDRVIAMGVGIGASIFVAAAAQRPKVFTGLILISPIFYPCSMMERFMIRAENVFSKGLGLGLNRHVKDRFLSRWLSDDMMESNSAVVQSIEDALDRLNARNIVRLLDIDSTRPDISSFISKVQAKTLIITGKASNLCYHTEDGFPLFKPNKTTWLNIADAGSLVHDECPEEVAKAISLFLQGFAGYS